MSRPLHEWKRYTPKMAKDALATNEVNRNIRDSVVEKYARDMSNDAWGICTNPIVFDEDGKLIDGQHRLTAQVRSNSTIEWLVLHKVPRIQQKHMDNQTVRQAADYLNWQGEQHAGLLAAVTRNVYRIVHDTMAGGTTITISEVLKTLEDHPDIRHSTEQAMHARNKSMTPIAPSVLGAAHWMISQVNGMADADIFLWRIIHLTREEDGSPVLALARRCNEIKRNQQRVQHRDYLAMVIKAWNLDAQNKTAVKISTYSKTGQYILPDVRKREIPLVDTYGEADDEEVVVDMYEDDVDEEGTA